MKRGLLVLTVVVLYLQIINKIDSFGFRLFGKEKESSTILFLLIVMWQKELASSPSFKTAVISAVSLRLKAINLIFFILLSNCDQNQFQYNTTTNFILK